MEYGHAPDQEVEPIARCTLQDHLLLCGHVHFVKRYAHLMFETSAPAREHWLRLD